MLTQDRRLPAGIRTLTVNGYQMAYLERGQGDPLLLVHGTLGDYRAWSLQMEPFSAGYRTIAVSLRHCYPEHWDGEGDDFAIHQHAVDLAAFVEQLAAGPVHLVGHSRGGSVALVMATAYPRSVQSLVLADPAPLESLLPNTEAVRAEIEQRKAVVMAALERLQCGDVDGGLELFTDAVSRPGTWQGLSAPARQIRRDNAWSLKSLVNDAQQFVDSTEAGKITAPKLLVTGAESPPVYGLMHAALQRWPGWQRQVTIPQASHGMHRDNPQVFTGAVLDFLSGI